MRSVLPRLTFVAASITAIVPGCSKSSGPQVVSPGEPSAADATQPAETIVALNTQKIDSGEVNLADAGPKSLELFLSDLSRRRDYDRSQHDGQPGPDSEYLSRWIDTVSAELERRGYTRDAEGSWHRPGNSAIVEMNRLQSPASP